MRISNYYLMLVLLASVSLVSCGGGGSDSPAQNQDPVVSSEFYAIGTSGEIIKSTSGSDWTTVSSTGMTAANISVVNAPDDQIILSAVNNEALKQTIVITTLNDIYYSSDKGKTWIHAKSPGQINNIINVGGTFIVVGGGTGFIERSVDGIQWDTVLSGGSRFESVAYGPDRIVAVGSGDRVVVSEDDGLTWINDNGGNGYQTRFNGIIYGNGKFVAVGTAINGLSSRWATSVDGLTWENETVDPNYHSMWDIAFGGGVFITGGYHYLLSSSDGITWSNLYTHEAEIRKITYFNGLFIAVGQNTFTGIPVAMVSRDLGISWSEINLGGIMSGDVVDVTTDVKPKINKTNSRIKGKIIDKQTGLPLVNVIVGGIDIDSGTIATVLTDSFGEYILDLEHNGDFELTASLNAYHSYRRFFSPNLPTETNDIELDYDL